LPKEEVDVNVGRRRLFETINENDHENKLHMECLHPRGLVAKCLLARRILGPHTANNSGWCSLAFRRDFATRL
jgi:hypothetical protein